MNLFAYGTLMWPEVLEAVIGRRLQGTPAVVHGYRRLRVRGERYPAVVPSASDSVEGILYGNLGDSEFEHLDRFEGLEYDRRTALVNGLEAQLYVLAGAYRHLADRALWRPEDMQAEHLAAFCTEYKGWHNN